MFNISNCLFRRAAALSLSTLLTLTMLASIDHLAQGDAQAVPWSLQRAATPAQG